MLASAVLVVVLATPDVALAQAGQTGGVIGKREKSISSEESAPAPRGGAAPARKPSAAGRRTQAAPSGCGGIVGQWRWLPGVRVVFNSNGTSRGSNGDSGTWSCAKGTVIASWKSGYVDTITMSPDGRHLSITNSAGLHFSARR